MNNRYLPLGSVVLLKNGNKKVMIYGRRQINGADGKEYDYAACLYPEGNVEEDTCFLFNNEQVDRVYFLGLQDSEEDAFQKKLLEQ